MKKNLLNEPQAELALQSLEGLSPAPANPYLFTKIQQRILNKKNTHAYGNMMFRLAIVLLIFIAANLCTYEKITSEPGKGNNNTSIEAFASDYGLSESGENI